jgi:hypothetical protein
LLTGSDRLELVGGRVRIILSIVGHTVRGRSGGVGVRGLT